MKIKYLIGAVLAFFVLYLNYTAGQNPKDYDDLLKEIACDKDLKSPTALPLAEAVLSSATNHDMQLTAKVLLAQVLGVHGDNKKNINDIAHARQLWTEVTKEGTGTWQAVFAQFNLIAEVGAQGKHDEQIIMAKDALAHLDFEVLEKSQDSALKALRKVYGDKPNIFREALKLMLVNALCDKIKIAEAKEVCRTIQDPEFAQIMIKRIQLAEKTEREQLLLKEAKEKSGRSKVGSNTAFSSSTNTAELGQ